jgi:hypothetical protein
MGIWTMPGYAFHFTVSLGFNIAESANMFLELGGWTLEKLWLVGEHLVSSYQVSVQSPFTCLIVALATVDRLEYTLRLG